jgi:putative ABC transport system ATP-binding protein
VIDLLIDVNRRRKTTVVLVTHDPELAQLAEVTVALRDGRIVSHIDRTATVS